MTNRHTTGGLAFALTALLGATGGLTPATAQAALFRDRERHYEIDLPGGWFSMDAATLKKINAFAKQMGGPNIQYVAGFQTSRGFLNAPYILVQQETMPTQGATFDEIESGVRSGLPAGLKQAKKQMGDLLQDLDVNEIAVDRQKRRIMMSLQMSDGQGNTLRSLSCGMIGKESVLFFHCYAPAKQFNAVKPEFQKSLDSFCYDLGYAFTPGTGSGGGGIEALFANVPRALVKPIIGGVVMAIVGALVMLFKRPNKPAATQGQPADDWPEEWAKYRTPQAT